MQTDTLSDVLRSVRLRGAVFYQIGFPAVWAVEAPPMSELGRLLFPDAEHVMEYHVLAKGSGWATMAGLAPVRLREGDVVIVPHGDAHVLSSDQSLLPTRIDPAWVAATRDAPKPIPVVFHSQYEFSPGEHATPADNEVVCGFLSCDRHPFNPLLDALPRLLHLPAGTAAATDPRSPMSLGQLALRADRGQPGAAALLERASETMFIDALRRYLECLPAGSTGWLAGLRDPQLGRALALIHRTPARPWTIDDLARAAGLSRSVFCARFLRLLGQPPMQYLARWRMEAAAGLLRGSRAPVASVALDVGYESEAAFARAFKREIGTSPARWRRMQHAQHSA
ncbi:AraC family transcriptional regulator [Massilia sp. Se16.2.3]|uniref:AraC family transcriptional regulator n=1 Tax=Massilia sp. Se16.2.3 TaxID=2709303 RepID=UPI001602A1CD|nr:AraC family transcriptional regulator [Massilia sp. Se16.2.3]QNA98670.1 AraC family transcriptional regulator [Massilia sp. Se16.2.3]